MVGSYHTELAAYAGLRAATRELEVDRAGRDRAPSTASATSSSRRAPPSDAVAASAWASTPSASGAGTAASTSTRFSPAKRDAGGAARASSTSSTRAGSPARRAPTCWPTPSSRARERDPRLHLVLAGGGPEEDALRERLGEHATFLGWLEGDALARAYASADLFLFASRTDTFGQVLLEAQASGLPVVAVAEGGPCSIVEDGVTGLLLPARRRGAGRRGARARGGAAAARAPRRSARWRRCASARWERALGRLADGYRRALGERAGRGGAACRLGSLRLVDGAAAQPPDGLALGAPAGDRRQAAQHELEVGHHEAADGLEGLGHAAGAMGREQQPLDRARRMVGAGPARAATRRPRRAGARPRRARRARRGRRRRRGS